MVHAQPMATARGPPPRPTAMCGPLRCLCFSNQRGRRVSWSWGTRDSTSVDLQTDLAVQVYTLRRVRTCSPRNITDVHENHLKCSACDKEKNPSNAASSRSLEAQSGKEDEHHNQDLNGVTLDDLSPDGGRGAPAIGRWRDGAMHLCRGLVSTRALHPSKSRVRHWRCRAPLLPPRGVHLPRTGGILSVSNPRKYPCPFLSVRYEGKRTRTLRVRRCLEPHPRRRMGGPDGDSHIDPTCQGPQREIDTTRSPDARRGDLQTDPFSPKRGGRIRQAQNLQLAKSRDARSAGGSPVPLPSNEKKKTRSDPVLTGSI